MSETNTLGYTVSLIENQLERLTSPDNWEGLGYLDLQIAGAKQRLLDLQTERKSVATKVADLQEKLAILKD